MNGLRGWSEIPGLFRYAVQRPGTQPAINPIAAEAVLVRALDWFPCPYPVYEALLRRAMSLQECVHRIAGVELFPLFVIPDNRPSTPIMWAAAASPLYITIRGRARR